MTYAFEGNMGALHPAAVGARLTASKRVSLLARARDARDLGDRRDAAAHLLQAVLAQAHHALAHRLVGDRVGGLARDRHLADRLGDRHDLVEADPALVAGAAAARAAD